MYSEQMVAFNASLNDRQNWKCYKFNHRSAQVHLNRIHVMSIGNGTTWDERQMCFFLFDLFEDTGEKEENRYFSNFPTLPQYFRYFYVQMNIFTNLEVAISGLWSVRFLQLFNVVNTKISISKWICTVSVFVYYLHR